MAISRLAISNPSSATNTLMYTGVRTILASIIATNKSNDAATIRVWVAPLDQDPVSGNLMHIAYDLSLPGKDTVETFRFPILTGDRVYLRASTGDISFTLSGIDDTNITGAELADLQSDISDVNSVASQALVLALIDI
jgi:hypothetical protein